MNRWMPAVRRSAVLLLFAALLPACGTHGDGTLNPTVAPQIPTGVTGVGAPLRSVLHWSASPIAATYKVRRSLFSGGPYSDVTGAAALTEPTFRDLGLQNGTAYYYVVTASNSFGTSPDSAEVKVVPGFKATQVSGGGNFSAVVMLDGSVWTMGLNDIGQLGMETPPVISTVAIEVPLPEPVIAVSAADRHCLALTVDGRVYAWGDNTSYQLGNTGPSTHVPALVTGLTGVRQISAGYQSSLVLMADGTVMAWGDNTYGQLGIGYGPSTEIPTPVPGLSDILVVSAGAGFNLALRLDGTIACWGIDNPYLLGTGVTPPPFGTVTSVANLSSVVAISGGYNHSTVLTDDGRVWTWGANASGELGNGQAPDPSPFPVEVLGLPTIVGISTGQAQVLCVAADGNVWAWGLNSEGEVGIQPTPSATDQLTPVQCKGVGRIAAVSAGYYHSLALGDDGTVWGWGSDTYGELGVGGGGLQFRPVLVPEIDSLASVSSRWSHTLALRTDGTVWAWSSNRWG
jgi:alpha-tubulin suppressor-like RCC1 family protein